MWIGVGKCLLFVLLRAAPGPIGLLFPRLVRVGSPGLFYLFPLPFRLFFLASVNIFNDISVVLPLLGGDPCRSVGDQPPVLTPRGDPTRLGDLSVDPPLVELLYSVWVAPLLRIIFLHLSGTQGGAGSPPPVEVNQAILACIEHINFFFIFSH